MMHLAECSECGKPLTCCCPKKDGVHFCLDCDELICLRLVTFLKQLNPEQLRKALDQLERGDQDKDQAEH
jgi:hypothetical protein